MSGILVSSDEIKKNHFVLLYFMWSVMDRVKIESKEKKDVQKKEFLIVKHNKSQPKVKWGQLKG